MALALALTSPWLLSGPARAQAADTTAPAATPLAQITRLAPPAARLDPVVVTATRTPQRIDDSLAQVTVIDRAELAAAAGRTLAELLSREAGVQMDASGGPGQLSAVRIRGMETRHTVLLIDGVRLGSLTSTAAPWQNLPLEAIERIEIVRGPLSSLYGADAAGGVIQVFTRAAGTGESGRVAAHAVLGAGTHRQRQLGAGLRVTQDAVDLHLQAERSRSDAFSATNAQVPFGIHEPDDDDVRRDAAGLRWVWRMAPGWRTEIGSLWSDSRLRYDNVSAFADAGGIDAKARSLSRVTHVQLVADAGPDWRGVLRASHSGDALIDLRGGFGDIGSVQRQWTFENTLRLPLGTLLAVLERTDQDVGASETVYAVERRHITGTALGWNGSREELSWQASVRHDRNSQFGGETTGTLSLGADANEVWRLGASVGTSFVAPSFADLYFPGSENPDLKPERGAHREVSVRALVPYGQWRLAWFDNRLRDAFSFSFASNRTENIDRTRSTGWSLSGDAEMAAWRLGLALDWTSPRNVTPGSADAGRLLPRRAQRTGRLSADWRAGAASAGASLQGASQRVESSGARMGGYATLDLHAGWQFTPEWTLALRINNAGDHDYETAYGYNQPGREAFVTLRYEGR